MANQKILAIDTSGLSTSVSVQDGKRVVTASKGAESSHNEEVWSAAERVLKLAGLKSEQLTHIVVGLGPGSFTGLRIGLAFAKGLAQSLKIGVSGYGSLRALAYNQHAEGTLVVSLSDAGRKQFFCCFDMVKKDKVQELGEHRILSADELVREVGNLKGEHSSNLRSVTLYQAGTLQFDSSALAEAAILPMPDISVCLLNAHAALSSQPTETQSYDPFDLGLLQPLYVRPVSALSIADRGLPPPRHI